MKRELKMDKCREEFESWYKNFSCCDVINFDEFGTPFVGEYKCASNWLQNTTLLASWQAWKASRENMKPIKLPDIDDYHLTSKYDGEGHEIQRFDCDAYQDSVIEAITSAGYKAEE